MGKEDWMKIFFRMLTFILFLMIFAQIYFISVGKSNYILLVISVICFVASYIMDVKEAIKHRDEKYKKLWDNLWKQYSIGKLTGNFKEGYALDEIMGTMEERYDAKQNIDIS